MIVVHIESGLGNQMLSYCELLAMRKTNPEQKIYIENIVYEIPECNESICQWNGYELDKVFKIKEKNVRELFAPKIWNEIYNEVRLSKFWEKNWNWPVYITRALNNAGIQIENSYGNREINEEINSNSIKGRLYRINFTQSRFGVYLRRLYYRVTINQRLLEMDKRKEVFMKTDKNLLTGQRLCFKYRNNDIESIKEEIGNAFRFPDFSSNKNRKFAEFLDSCNSVFIHARRGDMLTANGWCYKYGYFRRAVKYIKKHVESPIFVFFTNTGSIEWCKENAKTFGLDYSKDKVFFVDWNTGEESYRDMQLMSHCKHGIITNSTFGWWGAYFIKNPNKITISPELTINTTYHC